MQRLQKPQQQPLNDEKIVLAFQVIANPNNSRQFIKQADNFIKQCELNSEFAIVLMQIFSRQTQPQQKWQILIHLNNVIKRNWTTKRRVNQLTISEQTKNNIKQGLIQLYKFSWQNYYKQFNQIFKFLSRQQFPNNYLSLKNFILQILRELANENIEAFIGPEQLLPYLSLVKTIYKGDASKRFSNNMRSQEGYIKHIVQPVNLSLRILQKIDGALKMLQNMQQKVGDVKKANKLLQCSRKVDKIILYCFDYAVSSMQKDEKIRQVIQYLSQDKIKMLLNIRLKHRELNEQVQKNMLAIVEGCSNLQTSLPFVFTDCLEKYFQVIINLLINQKFSNEKLINRVIIANSKPLVTFVFFCTQAQFKQTAQCKRGSGSIYIDDRKKCYSQFMNIYGGGNTTAFMEKAITQLLDKFRGSSNQQYLFEENQNLESANQYVSYELILILIKNMLLRFKQELKPFILKILSHLLQNKLNSQASSVTMNMYEIILLLPKVYDEANINLPKVLDLMQNCYENCDYKMFSKLIKNYNMYFNETAVHRSFEMLAQIIMKPDINHQMMYECANCIKKLLNEHEQDGLPLYKLGPCLSNLLNLVSIYKNNPIYLWNLLQLITEILKSMSNEIVLINLPCIIQNLNFLVQLKDNDEPTVNAISDLLQNLLEQIPSEGEGLQNSLSLLQYLYEICMTLIEINLGNNKMQSPSILYKLWISVAKSVHMSHCSKSLAQKLLNALHILKDNILKQDPILLVELTEEYLLGGLIVLTPENIITLAQQVLSLVSFDQNNRTTFAIFSLYLSFYLSYNTFIPKMLCMAMSNLKELQNKISQTTNILRTFLMLVINYHIIELGPQKIFSFFNEAYSNNYQQWFCPYVWSLQYLNNKYSCKVASIAMLTSIDILKSAGILLTANEQFVPLQKIMKAVSFQIEAIPAQSAITSYMNTFKMMLQSQQRSSRNRIGFANNKGIPRKFKLHIKPQWAQCSLSGLYWEKFCPIISSLGWTSDTLDKKFDKLSSTKIIGLLTQAENKTD